MNVQNGRKDGKRTLTELFAEQQKAAMQYVRNQVPDLTDEQTKLLNDKFTLITQKGIDYAKKQRQVSGRVEMAALTSSVISDVSPYISLATNSKLTQIINIVETQDYNINLMMSSLNNIESQIYSLPVEEQPLVFEAISIARNSAQYWQANLSTWQQQVNGMLLYDSNGQIAIARTESVRWGAVAACDIGCGALMALGCYLSGPVGWAFSVKAVGGAAVVGSGIAAAVM